MNKETLLKLRTQPDSKAVKVRKINGGDFEYLPIESVRKYLHDVFGLYTINITKCEYYPEATQVMVTVSITVNIDGEAITVDGVGSSIATLPKDGKNSNSFEMALPHAKSDAIKNAAIELGALFGSELNTGYEFGKGVDTSITAKIHACKSVDELAVLFGELNARDQKKYKHEFTKAEINLNN